MTENTNAYVPRLDEDPAFEVPKTSTPIHEGSALDVLKAAAKEEVENPDLIIRIPSRPKLRGIFDTYIDGEKFQLWQRRCTNKKLDTLDVLKFSAIILANQLKGVEVEFKGKYVEARSDDGDAMSFQNAEFREMFAGGAPARETTLLVRKFMGNDGAVISAAREVIEAAGYGDELNDFEVDPTGV